MTLKQTARASRASSHGASARRLRAGLALAAALATAGAHAADIEVLHWWTSGGEAKALGELIKKLESDGHRWRDFPVLGGGGDNAAILLKTRVVSGYPPTAAQIKGPEIQQWAKENYLATVTDAAKAQDWDSSLPRVVAAAMKYQGRYVAAPVNVHRVNWMWINTAALKKAGVEPPTTWDELFKVADALQKAGIIPIAHGGQPWQDFTLFESIVLGQGGAGFYNKVFVELDAASIQSPTMAKSLETFRKVRQYMDKGTPNREWNAATAMVIKGQAAIQFMGDWAKGEFSRAGKVPGQDYLCVPAPGTDKSYSYNIDSFAFFRQRQDDAKKAQADLAAALMSPEFQETFNLAKGSIPVRTNANMSKFDACAQRSAKDFKATAEAGTLVPSIAHHMAAPEVVFSGMQNAVSAFFNEGASISETQARMVAAAKAAEVRE